MFILTCAGGWFKNTSFDEKFALAAKLGFKAVEILDWTPADFFKAKEAIDRTGCALSAILVKSRDEAKQALISNDHGIVREDALDAFCDSISETLTAALAMECKNIVVTTGNEQYGVSRKVQHGNIVSALTAAAGIVAGSGVTLVLEPLNILVNHMGYFLTTTAEGAEIIDEVGSPQVKLLYDVYHQQITEGNLINNIRNNIGRIGHIHIGDVPGRNEPGTGEINYKNVFKAIADAGYDKFVVFECGLTEDLETVVGKTAALMP